MSDNTAQIEFWNGTAGDAWVRAQARMDAMLAPLSDVNVLSAADAETGLVMVRELGPDLVISDGRSQRLLSWLILLVFLG